MSISQSYTLYLLHDSFIPAYFLLFGVFGLTCYINACLEPLKAITIAFASHMQFLMILDDKFLKRLLTAINLIVVTVLFMDISNSLANSFYDEPEYLWKNLKYFWILLYYPNYLCFNNFLKTFQKDFNGKEKTPRDLYQASRVGTPRNGHIRSASYGPPTGYEQEIDRLKNTLQARELFVASFSHEIRNSLNSIIGNIELLKPEISNPQCLKKLETCLICTEMVMDQVNDALDVAKIDADKLELNYAPDDFFRLIDKVWNISAVRIQQKNIQGELYVSRNFPQHLKCDSHRLTQILMNLLGNATKFTKKGFVQVLFSWHEDTDFQSLQQPNYDFLRRTDINTPSSIDTHDSPSLARKSSLLDLSLFEYFEGHQDSPSTVAQEIGKRKLNPKLISQMLAANSTFISSNEDNAFNKLKGRHVQKSANTRGIIKIEVIDSGCGLSHSSTEKLFQPYAQGDASIASHFGGTGLGLYISKRLVEKMNGEIRIYSKQNVGTNFCVLIPAETSSLEEHKFSKNEAMNIMSVGLASKSL